jgi:polysaccharide pyruvyl transferase WcaK-like protein
MTESLKDSVAVFEGSSRALKVASDRPLTKALVGREVLVIGHYGGSNTGDEAMLVSLLAMLPPSIHVSIVTKDSALQRGHEQNIGHVAMEPRAVFRAIRSANMVLLGGGTHFHDDYRGGRLRRHYTYMARYLAVFAIAKLFRKRIYYVGMGFGPFSYRFTKLLTRCILSLADGISVRDQASLDEAVKLGAGSKTLRSFDLAACLAPSLSPETCVDDRCLAVSITDMPGMEGNLVSGEQVFSLLADSLRTLLRARPDLRIKVIVVRGGTRESDLEVSGRLVEALSDYSDRVTLVPYLSDPVAVLNEFKTSFAACVMRYHGGMFAYLAGCRMLLLPYHRKLIDLSHEIGLSSMACPPLSQLDSETLVTRLSDLMDAGSTDFKPTLPVAVAQEMVQKNAAFWN